jgi:bifunctional UDP-N-acetylglucosamine pyrophosphorylase / glucosamine-1-phosphate N-acetyltransferase
VLWAAHGFEGFWAWGGMSDLAVVVLAAGMGTRMKSALPKVLHKIAGRSLIGYVLHAAKALNPKHVVVVHGPGPEHDGVKAEASRIVPGVLLAEQKERKGTGHAVSMAETALSNFKGTVLVLFGDCPLVQPESLSRLLSMRSTSHSLAVLGFEAADPTGYGRLIQCNSDVVAIREHKDTNTTERAITLCNSGIVAISAELLWPTLHKLSPANAQGELYFTDVVELVSKDGHRCALSSCDEAEVAGVNDRVQLAALETNLQARLRRQAMLSGATLLSPDTVYFSADTVIGKDVVIEPNVFFGPGVTVGDDVEILAFSHIEGATIGKDSRVGPFARLRPGADLGEKSHVGNYVEIKKAVIGKGAKVNHLTYIGDARIGAGSNIGAGTITCNYDGYEKHVTEIGDNVFVGSNTALVAPVKVGSGANIAAGSVITADVPEDALAMTRAPAVVKDGWAKRYRAMKTAKKAAKSKS